MLAAVPRRPLAFALIALAHVGGGAALSLGGGSVPAAAAPTAITLHDIPDPRPLVAAPRLTLTPIAVDIAPPLVEIAADDPGGVCDMLAAVGSAVAGDAAAQAAIAALPAASANAVMLWDGRWQASAGGAIRTAIVERLRAVAPACRDAALTGPRLVIVVTDGAPAALALGSGMWRWSDLLTEATG